MIDACLLTTAFHFGNFVYAGSDVTVEGRLIENFCSVLVHLEVSIHGRNLRPGHYLVNGRNQEARNQGHAELCGIDPHVLSSIMYRYLYIELMVSVGRSTVCPSTCAGDYDLWT